MTRTTAPGMHIAVSGSGPAVVLTHGFADDSSTFDPLSPVLDGSHRIGRWDLPGHGRSVAGPDPASRETALEWLDAAMVATGSPAVLVGHSLGGYLSLCRTVLDPAGVLGLVVIATGPGFRDPVKRAEWNEFIESYASRQGVDALAHGIAAQPDSVVMDGLAAIDVPVLVIVGADDRRYHAGSRVIADTVADSELVVVEGAGHFPHRSHPEEVGQHLRAFLDRLVPDCSPGLSTATPRGCVGATASL